MAATLTEPGLPPERPVLPLETEAGDCRCEEMILTSRVDGDDFSSCHRLAPVYFSTSPRKYGSSLVEGLVLVDLCFGGWMLVLRIDLCVGGLVLVLTGRPVCWRLGDGVDGSTCVSGAGCWCCRVDLCVGGKVLVLTGRLVCWRTGVGVDGSTCVSGAG